MGSSFYLSPALGLGAVLGEGEGSSVRAAGDVGIGFGLALARGR